VAVFAPASSPPDPQAYADGVAALRQRGLNVEAPESIPSLGYLAGPDDVRIEAWNDLLERDDIDAIICARGGYGTLRILPYLDYDRARERAPLIVGYSDVTALQLALLARAGVPSLSGPMVAPDWSRMDDFSEDLFWRFASGEHGFEMHGPKGDLLWKLKEGTTEGMIVGGNLTMIASLLGTPFMPELDGAILFLEEIGEPPYRVDRLLAQLHLGGVFDRIGGLVFGAFTGISVANGSPTLHLREVIDHYAQHVNGPVAGGLIYGHIRPKLSIPIGVQARLEVVKHAGILTITEPLTA
jgi:muramoyltetrapeptide carboxypeptidase